MLARLVSVLLLAWVGNATAQDLLFESVRLFDGTGVTPSTDVLILDGAIAEVGDVDAPEGVPVIDGAGRTLLPGLIDAHTHVFNDALEQAIIFGVTTELDMFTSFELAGQLRGNRDPNRADLRSAGTLVTAPGGHGTQFGMPIPTLESPEDASAFVDARLAEGSDYIKLVYDDGSGWGGSIPTLSLETLAACIEAAHRRGKLAVVHIHSREMGREALDAGADGLVHLFLDEEIDDAFVAAAKQHNAFIVPTLAVIEGLAGRRGGATLLANDRVRPYVRTFEESGLKADFPIRGERPDYGIATRATLALSKAGVPILAGSDAPNPGTAHGVSLLRELQLLVEAGLSPLEALRSATSVSAAAFGLDDRGRVAPGQRADLLLVEGDPTANIDDVFSIVSVYKLGHEVPRDAWREEIVRMAQATTTVGGAVSDFEQTKVEARFGAGWATSIDQMAGGTSSASIALVKGGANDSEGALEVTGEIELTYAYPWAGAIFYPGTQPFQPADLSAATKISFAIRGDVGQFRVMLFAASLGRIPRMLTIDVTDEWNRLELDLKKFGSDGSDIQAILWTGGPAEGPFRFVIDDVSIE